MEARRDAFIPDPVLGGLLGLCPLVAAADTLADGVILGLGASLSAAILGAGLPAFREFIPDRLRAPLALGLAAFLAALFGLAAEAYSPALAAGLGLYLPLIAVNCVTLAALRRGIRSEELKPGLLRSSLSYLLAAVLISALREAVGLGRLTLPTPGPSPYTLVFFDEAPFRLLAAPAGGFLILGCLAAAYRFALRALGRRLP